MQDKYIKFEEHLQVEIDGEIRTVRFSVSDTYHPKLKTNIVSATLASLFNMALNAWFLYEMFSKNLVNIKAEVFMFWLLLYAVKVFALPLIMLGYENHCYGASLAHSTAYKKNASKPIHL